MFALKTILVPTDLSFAAIDAVHYAKLFAERFGAKLTLFYVDPILGFGLEGPMYMTTSPEHYRRLEEEVRLYARQAVADFPFDVFVAGGQPVPIIIREADERAADLVVMATHGLGGWRRAILGSVTQGVLHGGHCPVLSLRRAEVKGRPEIAVRKIVCPINFTDVARESLNYAADIAKAFNAELLVAHVVEDVDAAKAAAAEATLKVWIDASLRNKYTYREIVLRGGVAERVLDFAEDSDADLVVIGAQHKMFRDETVIGTTTERLVRFARVPVLSVPRPVSAAKETSREQLAVAAPCR